MVHVQSKQLLGRQAYNVALVCDAKTLSANGLELVELCLSILISTPVQHDKRSAFTAVYRILGHRSIVVTYRGPYLVGSNLCAGFIDCAAKRWSVRSLDFAPR